MQPTLKTLLFFGNERLVSGLKATDAPVLRGLIERGYTIKAVISHHSDSKSRTSRPLEVAEIARQHDIPVFLPSKPADITNQIADLNADAAILVAYGRIIPQRVIDLFPQGIINIHPSLLPKYRGPTPIETAILNGDTTTGVSIMQLTAGMDSGPIFGQVTVDLSPTDDKFDAYKKLSTAGAEFLFQLLPDILSGTLVPTPQGESQASYTAMLTKADAILTPAAVSAALAERQVRAHLGYPKTKYTLAGHPVIITKAHVSTTQKTPLDVLCQDGAFLSIDELIAPNGKRMSGEAFLRGYAAAA